MPTVAPQLLMFHPERWGQVDRFRRFYSTTYEFTERQQRAVMGVEAHFEKFLRLQSLAASLLPRLQIDEKQLEEQGFTPAENARDIAVLIEAAVLELYSAVDCTRQILETLYQKGTRHFQKDSTEKLFNYASKFEGTFPDELKPLFTDAPWYWKLVKLRKELVHLSTGSICQERESKSIRYDHFGLKEGNKPYSIDNIFEWLDDMMKQVNQFLGQVFKYLNSTLDDKPVHQICGMVEGRVLYRYLSPVGDITFDSGACGAQVWFDLPDSPTCPFKERCGAYQRPASLSF